MEACDPSEEARRGDELREFGGAIRPCKLLDNDRRASEVERAPFDFREARGLEPTAKEVDVTDVDSSRSGTMTPANRRHLLRT